jgi:hypothetical protein
LAKIKDADGNDTSYSVTIPEVHVMKKGNVQLFMGNKGGYFFIVRDFSARVGWWGVGGGGWRGRAAGAGGAPTFLHARTLTLNIRALWQVKSQSKGMGDSGADALAAMAIGFYYTCGADA